MTDAAPHPDVRPPAMLAADLTFDTLPMWLRLGVTPRFRTVDVDRLRDWSWHTWYRMALDLSGLPIVPRTVARVLTDWHTSGAPSVTLPVALIAPRVPCHPDHALRALDTLESEQWAGVSRRRGMASTVALLCPVDDGGPPAPRAGVTPAPRAAPPAPRAGDPRATRGTKGNRGTGEQSGEPRVANFDAVPRAPRPGFGGWQSNRPRGPRGPRRPQ